MAMPRPNATGSHSIQRLRSASRWCRIQVRAPATPSPLFDRSKTLAYLRRAFPAEMRSKQYLWAFFRFWVTFWVTISPFSPARGQPHDSRVGVNRATAPLSLPGVEGPDHDARHPRRFQNLGHRTDE